MQKPTKNTAQKGPLDELNEVLQDAANERASREELSYDTDQLPRSACDDNSRPERELSGAELERAKEEYLSNLSADVIPNLTPKNPYWKFVLGSEDVNASPSLYDLLSRGYKYVTPDDCAENASHLLVKTEGDHSGFLRRKEMVYLKIPKVLYEAALEELHHNQPALRQANAYASYLDKFESEGRRNMRAGAKFNLGEMENLSFRDERTNELLGFVPGHSERNSVGVPKIFGKPTNWDNLSKANSGRTK